MFINQQNGIVSNRAVDSAREANMQEALNDIYRRFNLSTIRVSDRDLQLKGVDLYMKEPNGDVWIKVDEKAASTMPKAYVELPTFCFEISALNNPNRDGWLFKEDSETTHYAIIYPMSSDNFKTLEATEILIIEKQSILDKLWEQGIGCKEDAEALINTLGRYDNLGRLYYRVNDAIKLVKSLQLAEQPLNAIIDRGVLRRMAKKVINYNASAEQNTARPGRVQRAS